MGGVDAAQLVRRAAPTVAVGLVVLAVHLRLSASIPGPSLLWDGTANLGIARWLAGEDTPFLGHLGHYAVGYPLTLVPVVWVTSSLDGLFDGARIVNAIVAASTVPALAALGVRLGGIRPAVALALAAGAALLPAVVVQSGFEWAESLFLAAVIWTALAAVTWAARPTAASSAVLALAAAGTYLVHSRGLSIVLATVIVLAAGGRRGVLGIVIVLAGAGAIWAFSQHAIDVLWHPAREGQWHRVVGTVTTPSRWADVALWGTGQLWYAVVATVGLAGAGLAVLVIRVRRSPSRADALGAVWLLLALLITAGMSVAMQAGGGRPDQLVYGRYLDPLLPVLVVLGGGAVVARAARAGLHVGIAIAVGAIAGAVVVAAHGSDALEGVFMPLNLLGAIVFDPSRDARIDVLAITALGAITGAVIVAAIVVCRRWPVVLGVVLAGAAVAGSASVADRHVRPFAVDANQTFVLGEMLHLVDPTAPVSHDMAVFDARGSNRYVLGNPEREIAYFDSRQGERPRHELVVAGKDPARPPAPGARAVFPEPRFEQTLWVLPGRLQDRLAAGGFLITPAGAKRPNPR